MKCNKCNQNSIYTYHDDYSNLIIECNICGAFVKCEDKLGKLSVLLRFNFELERAEGCGDESHNLGLEKSSNPYSLSSKDIALNKSWESGWESAKNDADFFALAFSSEKINKEIKKLEALNKKLEEDKKEYKNSYEQVLTYVKCLGVATYKLGRTYRKKIASFLE